MSFFDAAYDEMSWQEVCYRLPSELAINALKRRINNLDTVKMFIDNVGSQPKGIKPLKEHVNIILSAEKPEDIYDKLGGANEATLFEWLDDSGRERIKEANKDKLTLKFLFNTVKGSDGDGIKAILSRVLAEPDLNTSHVRHVFSKADDDFLPEMVDMLIKDPRPEARVCILSIPGRTNKDIMGEYQKIIGLKALAKCADSHPIAAISVLSIDAFKSLRPGERLTALERYLEYFPRFRKIPAFSPMPAKEELDLILFAGCIEFNEQVERINKMYDEITTLDPTGKEEGDE
jgi:hypothetical protein